MLDEPKLFTRYLSIRYKCPIVSDKCLKLPSQGVALDPIHHETAVTGTRSNTIVGVDEVKVFSDILPGLDQIIVGVATCGESTSCWKSRH
jgi:hypothetical protein